MMNRHGCWFLREARAAASLRHPNVTSPISTLLLSASVNAGKFSGLNPSRLIDFFAMNSFVSFMKTLDPPN
jgi:hypothetical protein